MYNFLSFPTNVLCRIPIEHIEVCGCDLTKCENTTALNIVCGIISIYAFEALVLKRFSRSIVVFARN